MQHDFAADMFVGTALRLGSCAILMFGSRESFVPLARTRSGRSAAWLARLVRDQEVDGSNPFAPTILLNHLRSFILL
jgi:hypothetical protein